MKYLILLLATQIFAPPILSQSTEARNLLEELGNRAPAVSGEWTANEGSLEVAPSAAALCRVAEDLPDEYDLIVEFTRTEGEGTVIVVLPVGAVSPALEIAAWDGESHGLSRVDGLPSKDPNNPTAVFPGLFENGEKQTLFVSVKSGETSSTVTAKLNGKELFDWTGANSSLDRNVVMNLPVARTLGLGAHDSRVVFHKALLRAATTLDPPSPMSTNKDPENLSSLGEFGSPGWKIFNDGGFSRSGAGVEAVPDSGQGDRGAYLEGVEFSEGAVEVELQGANQPGGSFLGVVFHGVDGDTYESIYFRPFNFGHSDPVRRSHAVQYICHPDWPWEKLRQQRNGEFEAAVNPEPKPDDRFKARIEIADGRVRAFVNGSDTPSLDVERLSSIEKGKVGVWYNGVATFYEFKVTEQ